MKIRHRVAAVAAASVVLGGGVAVFTATTASAHGAATSPGSRTYLCYNDGIKYGGGDIKPKNPACAAAVANDGTQPLWDWFGVLRGDGAGRMEGFIPDGELCSGGNEKWTSYNAARSDWPYTRLTSGDNITFRYNAWAPHPGQFRLYVTKDGYDPNQPLAWSDLESEPFSVWNETVPNGNGEYYWDVTLPSNKSGRHIIYSVWARTDSKETFYNCSDVEFDGGNGEVVYDGSGGTTTPPRTTTTTTTPKDSTTTTTTTGGQNTTTTTTTSQPRTTTTTTTTTTGGNNGGNNACTATYRVLGQWMGGFQAEVTVTNTGTTPLTSWKAAWEFANGQSVTSGWNATITANGSSVTATNMAYNGSVGVGQSQSFGFLGQWNGTNSVPVVSCNGATPGGGSSTTTTSRPADTTTTTTTTSRPADTTTTTTTTTTSNNGGGNGSLLNDGFEAQNGSSPSLGWTTVTKDCSGTGKASIDSSVAHSGGKSLRIDGGVGYCNHVFVQAPVTPESGSDTYVRAYIRHTTALPTSHVTFIAMNDANDNNGDLRIGGQNRALQWNRQSDDATLPAQSPTGVSLSQPLATDTWQCFEYKVGADGTAKTWINGQEVAGLTVDGTPTADVDQQWLAKTWRPKLTNIRFGWESYGEGADTLWYDDIAVSTSRIGC